MKPSDRLAAILANLAPLFGPIALLYILSLAAWLLDDAPINTTMIGALVSIVIVVGLYVFIGNSGVISFGSMAFVAIGAYAMAAQTCCEMLKPVTMTGLPDFLKYHTYPTLPSVLSSGALAALVALIVGRPIMGLSGIPSSIATFMALGILNVLFRNWDSVTLGESSIVGLPAFLDVWASFAWAAIAILIAFVYQRSRYGLMLRATREDEVAARSAGIRIPILRMSAWVISAFLLGIGGALYSSYIGVISVNAFFLDLTFSTLAMLVVGGMRSIYGAVVGVVVIAVFSELLRKLETGVEIGSWQITTPSGFQEVLLGLIMLIVLIRYPRGITRGEEFQISRLFGFLRRRSEMCCRVSSAGSRLIRLRSRKSLTG
jgi:branched-chain amino acid transport system permease protein